MDISKLKRQFIREARSSPKKVAVLALVSAVAAWRFVPLLAGVLSGGAEVPQVAAQRQTPPAAAGESPTTSRSIPARPSWRELDRRISADPLMQSAELAHGRNPFGDLSLSELAAVEVETSDTQTPALSAAGLVLSSTAVGTKRRSALINGRIYVEGDVLDLPRGSAKVVSIRPRSVVLEGNGEQLELTIAERPAGERIQLRRGSSAASTSQAEG
jgi:hypothetical protein